LRSFFDVGQTVQHTTQYAPQPGRATSIKGKIYGLGCLEAGGVARSIRMQDTTKETSRWKLVRKGRLADVQRVGTRNRLAATGHAQFAIDVVDVTFHRADGDHQRLRDGGVGPTGHQEPQYVAFALGKRFD